MTSEQGTYRERGGDRILHVVCKDRVLFGRSGYEELGMRCDVSFRPASRGFGRTAQQKRVRMVSRVHFGVVKGRKGVEVWDGHPDPKQRRHWDSSALGIYVDSQWLGGKAFESGFEERPQQTEVPVGGNVRVTIRHPKSVMFLSATLSV